MTKGAAKVLETDVIIFPMEFEQEKQAAITAEEIAVKIAIEKQLVKTDVKDRFARLKKSLRKRSVSIL